MVLKVDKKQKTANLKLVKQANLTLVFNLINRYQPVSRADIAHTTGLSPTTVSSLADELIAESMVIETGVGKLSGSGRKPVMLAVNPHGGCVVGVELRADDFVLEAFDLTGESILFHTREIGDYEKVGEHVADDIESLVRSRADFGKLLGICVGVPGIIDRKTKRISSTIIPVDAESSFFDVLRARFPDITLKLGNESSFCAYIEKSESTEEIHSLVYIDINVGIGAGIILDDRIFTGAFGNAGEFGHVSIDLNGKKCKCGNCGCIEVMANVPEIKRLVGCASLSEIDYGNHDVQSGVATACKYISAAINNVINVINPEAVVLGGEITDLGEPFLEMLRQKLYSIMFRENRQRFVLRFSSVSGNAVTRGCGRYMLDRIFEAGEFVTE